MCVSRLHCHCGWQKTDFSSQILGLMFSDFTPDGAADVATAPLKPPDVSAYLHVLSRGEYKPRSKAPELVWLEHLPSTNVNKRGFIQGSWDSRDSILGEKIRYFPQVSEKFGPFLKKNFSSVNINDMMFVLMFSGMVLKSACACARLCVEAKCQSFPNKTTNGKRLDNERGACRFHGESASTCLSSQTFKKDREQIELHQTIFRCPSGCSAPVRQGLLTSGQHLDEVRVTEWSLRRD